MADNITYEQVAEAANFLHAKNGTLPTGSAVFNHMVENWPDGKPFASKTTVVKFVTQWLAQEPNQSRITQVAPEVSAAVLKALTAANAKGREDQDKMVAHLHSELASTVRMCQKVEVERDAIDSELVARTRERDLMEGQLAERAAEVAKLEAALAASAQRVASLETEFHDARLQALGASSRIDEIRASTEKQLEEVRGERDRARDAQADAQRRAIDGEQSAAVAGALLENERSQKAQLSNRTAELQTTIVRLEQEALRAAVAATEVAGQALLIKRQDEVIATLQAQRSTNHADH